MCKENTNTPCVNNFFPSSFWLLPCTGCNTDIAGIYCSYPKATELRVCISHCVEDQWGNLAAFCFPSWALAGERCTQTAPLNTAKFSFPTRSLGTVRHPIPCEERPHLWQSKPSAAYENTQWGEHVEAELRAFSAAWQGAGAFALQTVTVRLIGLIVRPECGARRQATSK